MTPAQLRAFAAIVRHGSARRAAAEVGISEAAVSSHTAALRKELCDPLYRRSGNGLVFTPGGMRLASRAGELLGLHEQTHDEVSAAAAGQRLLRVAATSMFAEWAAPGAIELFRTRATDLEVEVSERPGSEFEGLLSGRQAHVVVGPSRSLELPVEVSTVEFLRYRVRIVGAAGPATNPRTARWLLGPSALDAGSAASVLLQRFEVPEERRWIFRSHTEALDEARTGGGVTLLPEFRIRREEGSVAVIDVPGSAADGVWMAAALTGRHAADGADELLRFFTTPKAVRALLRGSATHTDTFRPRVHVTLWS